MEKVIRELRVIETDDGYRIEVKGDKERMKHFLRGFRGRHGRRRRHGPFRIFGMPPGFGFGGPGFWAGFGPWDADFVDDFEEEGDDEDEAEEA